MTKDEIAYLVVSIVLAVVFTERYFRPSLEWTRKGQLYLYYDKRKGNTVVRKEILLY